MRGLSCCLDDVLLVPGVLVSDMVAILSLDDEALSGVPLSDPPKSVSLLVGKDVVMLSFSVEHTGTCTNSIQLAALCPLMPLTPPLLDVRYIP